MTTPEAMVEKVARLGYEAAIAVAQAAGALTDVQQLGWNTEPERLREDWRTIARAQLPALAPVIAEAYHAGMPGGLLNARRGAAEEAEAYAAERVRLLGATDER